MYDDVLDLLLARADENVSGLGIAGSLRSATGTDAP